MKKEKEPQESKILTSVVAKLDAMPSIKITSLETQSQATEYLSQANKYLDALTKDKETMTKPLNEALKAIRNKYSPTETKLKEIISNLRSSLTIYQTEQIALQKKAEEKVIARLEKGTIKAETAVQKIETIQSTGPQKKTATDSGSITFRPTQTLKITDPLAIPREYLIINESLLLADLKANKVIPGAEIVITQTLINRRG